ncbi:Rid family detoxifying hydrolase [Pedobacter sp. WC2423]|uniref:Rid family detoxifying hydrolase n=1 Tax=Pedobacter sp. WC2423 TaxID=3234142 RepID=UPI0034655818
MKKVLLILLFIYSFPMMAQQKDNLVQALPYSKVKSAKDFVFLSGQIGINSTTGLLVTSSFEAEVHQVMKNIASLLHEKGLTYSDLVNVTIYLKSMDNYAITNQVYRSYFTGDFPARVCMAVTDLPAKANIEIAATALNQINSSAENKQLIRRFLEEVRSGKNPDRAGLYMADTLLAHQLNAEAETTVTRTPQNYAEHVKEFLTLYGNFHFEITEIIAEGDRVYVRWKQTGKHLATIDGHPATGKPIIEIASAVYRLENGKIKEYWIQIDRLGFEKQL